MLNLPPFRLCPSWADLPPIFWTALSWKIPVMPYGPIDGANNEDIEVFGGADCLRAEAGRGRRRDWRGLSQGRDFRGDLLHLAQEVRRPNAVGDEATASARG